jgi:hypothetical protein
MAARNFVAWRYTDDNGQVFVRRADTFFTSQTAALPATGGVGGSSAAGLTPYEEMPRNLKPRRVLCVVAGGGPAAWVVIYDPTTYNDIVTGTTTLDFRTADGVSHTGVVIEKAGERPRGAIRP